MEWVGPVNVNICTDTTKELLELKVTIHEDRLLLHGIGSDTN